MTSERHHKVCPVQGKRMFKHYQDAARILKYSQKPRLHEAANPQSMYRCSHCKTWHVTSYTPAETKAIQQTRKAKQQKVNQ